jgi:hypothetical protein
MSNIDDIRAKLYKGEGEFVEQLKTSDKAPEELRTELLVRLNLIYKYASIKGRGRFLDEMKLPGAAKERKVAFDVCVKAGKPQVECDALMGKMPLFRPLREAWPKENTIQAWWSAPLTHLIGTYDPDAPPAGELADWRENLTPLAKGAAVVDEVVDDIGEAVGDLSDSLDEALEPEPETVSWWKVGAAVGATAITGALVYRIAKG